MVNMGRWAPAWRPAEVPAERKSGLDGLHVRQEALDPGAQ